MEGVVRLISCIEISIFLLLLLVDGCSKGNPGPSGGGSLVINDSGDLIWAMANSYGIASNICAKAVKPKLQCKVWRNAMKRDFIDWM